jgi:hypothetical protein
MHPQRRSIRRNPSSATHPLCELGPYFSAWCRAHADCASVQVLYYQSHPRNRRSRLRIGSSVQNGASMSTLGFEKSIVKSY